MKKAVIYTRTGDSGTTSLVGGKRALKHSDRIEAYGTLDELNSAIGLITASTDLQAADREFLTDVQSRLFDIGSHLACPPDGEFQLPTGLTDETLAAIETEIDRLDSKLPRLDSFVLPAGSELAARCHMARTICRRAERRITALNETEPVGNDILAYINRLSDYLFTLARHSNISQGNPEIFWSKK
ncbi:cob(I)yrinic acid a,c-diamide adenosyltransferase [uncultured Muribaculum sp.]|uniref:cob(I)yrinic acid a,c-diamide adenosyltransferase n=1 Tax=uncultured Muribaculum sp. TaxID=1918613 RepID=UPI00272B019C|nr:cob(I)yrinic acid a,c-diamide adenosyltransferase [uncultured Muribaculum sp.]